MINSDIAKKIALVLALILISVISIIYITPWATSVQTHSHSIEQIDSKVTTVMELTAGATAASTVLSFIPDDACTPVANQLAEFGKYFLIVLSALYLEKYLVTAFGFITFSILIPLVCLCFGIGILGKKDVFLTLSVKLFMTAMVIFMAVPCSVKVSDMIYKNYETSIESTINEAVDIGQKDDDSQMSNQITKWIKESSEKAVDYVSGVLSHFAEALAVMIVTSCIIPVLVLVFLVVLIKIMFGIGRNG